MNDAFAHLLENRLGARKGLVAAAAHESERAGLRAADAARDGGIQKIEASLFRRNMHGTRRIDVDGRTVDEQGILARGRKYACIVQINGADMASRGKHRHDDVSALDRLERRLCLFGSRIHHGFERRGTDVEGFDLFLRLQKVARHRRAHVSDADECDGAHSGNSLSPSGSKYASMSRSPTSASEAGFHFGAPSL